MSALAEELNALVSSSTLSVVRCVLSRFRDVRAAVAEIHERHTVFGNAGLGYAVERMVPEDGVDSHLQINCPVQFMMTFGLLNLLEGSNIGGCVVLNVPRAGHLRWEEGEKIGVRACHRVGDGHQAAILPAATPTRHQACWHADVVLRLADSEDGIK